MTNKDASEPIFCTDSKLWHQTHSRFEKLQLTDEQPRNSPEFLCRTKQSNSAGHQRPRGNVCRKTQNVCEGPTSHTFSKPDQRCTRSNWVDESVGSSTRDRGNSTVEHQLDFEKIRWLLNTNKEKRRETIAQELLDLVHERQRKEQSIAHMQISTKQDVVEIRLPEGAQSLIASILTDMKANPRQYLNLLNSLKTAYTMNKSEFTS